MRADDRSDKTTRPRGYVVMTDNFMSNWGGAAGGKSYYALAYHTAEEADALEGNAHGRSEMKRVRTVISLRADGTPIVKMGEHDHLKVVDRGTASRWYEAGTW